MAKNKYAGKALKQVVDADEALTTAQFDVLGGLTTTAAELNVLDAVTAGTVAASKAVVVGSSKQVNEWHITATSASTSGTTSIEPMILSSTMSGAGGVGGRARFQLSTNVALGGWSNALKAITVYGASGRTTGMGSALCAEMTLSAGTTAGTYAPAEIELNLGTGAKTGTQTSLIYASVNGDDKGTFDDHGFILSLNGLTADTGHVFQAAAVTDIDSTHALRINIGGTAYFIPLHTSATFAP
jgi:hypothetical protein